MVRTIIGPCMLMGWCEAFNVLVAVPRHSCGAARLIRGGSGAVMRKPPAFSKPAQTYSDNDFRYSAGGQAMGFAMGTMVYPTQASAAARARARVREPSEPTALEASEPALALEAYEPALALEASEAALALEASEPAVAGDTLLSAVGRKPPAFSKPAQTYSDNDFRYSTGGQAMGFAMGTMVDPTQASAAARARARQSADLE